MPRSKGGVVGMTLLMARDLAQHKIRVATIAPGIFLTPDGGRPAAECAGSGWERRFRYPSRLGKPSEYGMMVESIVRNPMLNGEVHPSLDGAIWMAPRDKVSEGRRPA